MTISATDIAQAAAALVVEEGMELGAAKARALKQLGARRGTPMPDNRVLEAAVHEYIQIFRAEEQPLELHALRSLALHWMQRLQAFSPLLGGAVWSGTATRHSAIHLQLFEDDVKALPIWLLNQQLAFETQEATGISGLATEVLVTEVRTDDEVLEQPVIVCLWNNGRTALRGALQPDRDGQPPRGDRQALQARMAESPA